MRLDICYGFIECQRKSTNRIGTFNFTTNSVEVELKLEVNSKICRVSFIYLCLSRTQLKLSEFPVKQVEGSNIFTVISEFPLKLQEHLISQLLRLLPPQFEVVVYHASSGSLSVISTTADLSFSLAGKFVVISIY